MALRFIIGPSGSGKTEKLQEMVLKAAKEDDKLNCIVMVPEQSNMQMQRQLAMKSDCGGIFNIDVLSFERLSHRIFDEAGGNILPIIDDTAKSMIIRLVSNEIKDSLPVLGGRMNVLGYVNEVKSVISELMQYDIAPDMLFSIAEKNEDKSALHGKLLDVGRIYEAFLRYIDDKYVTMEELLDRAVASTERAAFLKKSRIYLDGYTGFTPVQIRFISHLMHICEEVVITVNLGAENINKEGVVYSKAAAEGLFKLSYNTLKQVEREARERRIEILEPVILTENKRHKSNLQLAFLEKKLFRNNSREISENKDTIVIYENADIRSEASGIGRLIHSLVRFEGYKYRDIAVLTGDVEGYQNIVQAEFAKYNIPLFIDKRQKVLHNPFTELIRAVFDILEKNFEYDSVFRFLKSSLAPFTEGEVDDLENYVLMSGIKRRSQYEKEWIYLPKGMDAAILPYLNSLRERLLTVLAPVNELIRGRGRHKVSKMLTVLYETLSGMELETRLNELSEEFNASGDSVRAQDYAQIYEEVMKLFERCYELLGEEAMSVAELSEIIDAGLMELSVGVLPQGADEIVFGDLERSRMDNTKVLILMGVNDGLIPKDEHKRGILSELDRRVLKEEEIELSPDIREQALIQKYYLYMYLTKPTDKLYLSYSLMGADGGARRPSYLINQIKRLYSDLEIKKSKVNTRLLTKREALEYLSGNLQFDFDASKQLITELADDAKISAFIRKMLMISARIEKKDALNSAVASALYGDKIYASVTRLEKFAKCAYAHFVQYGLKLKENREYGFEGRDLGNIYHDALEIYSRRVKEEKRSFLTIDEENISRLMNEAIDEALSRQAGSAMYAGKRDSYIENRIRRILKRTIDTVTYQLRKGDFEPDGFELKFSEKLPLSGKNNALVLDGRIDRLDTVISDGSIHVKIVDYKSGNNSLELANVYHGLSLQLLLYLQSAVEQKRRQNPNAVIERGGVLYYHVDDPLLDRIEAESDEETLSRINKELMPKGLVNSDERIFRHMDLGFEGSSDVIPVAVKKDGTLSSRSKVASTDEFIELECFVKNKAMEIGERILSGEIAAAPYELGEGSSKRTGCDYCNYKGICGFDSFRGDEYRKLPKYDKDDAMERIMAENREKGE